MKFRKDKDIIRFLGISLTAILFGLIIFLFIRSMSIFGFIFIISGLIGFLIALKVASKPIQDLIEDERSVRVREKAGYHAFLALLYVAALISLLRILKLSPSLTPSRELADVLGDMWVLGLLIFIVLMQYYNKKGE